MLSVPEWFDESARAALLAAAENAGINVLQLVQETSAASLVSVLSPLEGLKVDRISLIMDIGQSSLSLSLLSIRDGLVMHKLLDQIA